MRYQVAPMTLWQSAAGIRRGAVPKISWRVIDTYAAQPMGRDGTRAWSYDEAVARQVADMLNGNSPHASHWKGQAETARRNALALETRWQATLDHTNTLLREARAEADRLRAQLFEAREQRGDALDEAAELRKALEASHRELANARQYWANQGPHDHVVISLAGYNKLVTERDEALAKYAACVDIVSFVDGRWVKTS